VFMSHEVDENSLNVALLSPIVYPFCLNFFALLILLSSIVVDPSSLFLSLLFLCIVRCNVKMECWAFIAIQRA
jgi:hypothetical protein